jgi:hypothetical protein
MGVWKRVSIEGAWHCNEYKDIYSGKSCFIIEAFVRWHTTEVQRVRSRARAGWSGPTYE